MATIILGLGNAMQKKPRTESLSRPKSIHHTKDTQGLFKHADWKRGGEMEEKDECSSSCCCGCGCCIIRSVEKWDGCLIHTLERPRIDDVLGVRC